MSSMQTEATHKLQRLRCATCLTIGAVTWEDVTWDDTRPAAPHGRARNRLRKLVGLTAGFKSIDRGDRAGPVIACSGCGAPIAPL